MEKRYVDVNELSGYIGISKWSIYKMVQRRTIPFVPFGRIARFDLKKIDNWMSQKAIKTKKDVVGL